MVHCLEINAQSDWRDVGGEGAFKLQCIPPPAFLYLSVCLCACVCLVNVYFFSTNISFNDIILFTL